MTPSQRYYRSLARKATARAKRQQEKSYRAAKSGHNLDLANFYAISAGNCACLAARYAFIAHPELREESHVSDK